MSLEAILDAIHATGKDQTRDIEARAQTNAEQILAEAETEAQRLREIARAGVVAPAAAERARVLHQARVEALRIVESAREALVDMALSQTRECLTCTRSNGFYLGTLHQLTKETISELKGSLHAVQETRLDVDPRDRELLECVLQDLGLELTIRDALKCWGGLTAKSRDGRVVVVNTLEARLERATPYLRHYLATLFIDGRAVEKTTKDARQTV